MKPFVIEFFSVNEDCTLKEYIDKYVNGCMIVLHDMSGVSRKNIMDYRDVFDYFKRDDVRDYSV